ncbi:MAG: ATP-binding protein [Chlamydiales bacterium]|nr:ATP-binding protein [Chlamydiales bacterium]
MKIEEICFTASFEQLSSILTWIQTRCVEAGFSSSEASRIQLALEEVLVNVIRYAYPEKKGEVVLTCKLYPEEKIQFIVRDQGRAFNPLLQKPAVDLLEELHERKEGGLGIFFAEQLMDEIAYERLEPFNHLFLTKFLN